MQLSLQMSTNYIELFLPSRKYKSELNYKKKEKNYKDKVLQAFAFEKLLKHLRKKKNEDIMTSLIIHRNFFIRVRVFICIFLT